MKATTIFKNIAVLEKNKAKARKIEPKTKLDKLYVYLLQGRPVTGATMIGKFAIYSYRDAIFSLRKRGIDIKGKEVREGSKAHMIWWLGDYDEEYALSREEKIF